MQLRYCNILAYQRAKGERAWGERKTGEKWEESKRRTSISEVRLSLFGNLSWQSTTYLLLEAFVKVTNDLVTFHDLL